MSKRRRRKKISVPAVAQIALVAVLAAAAGGLVIAALTQSPPATEAATPVVPQIEEPAERQRIAFLGDSWVGGTGAEPSGPANGYPGLAANTLGWDYEAFTGGGTGYTTGNTAGEGPFGDRVDAVIAYSPDVVVVQGSSNDYLADAATIEAAASEVFARLRAGLPDAELLVVGPIDSPASDDALMDVARQAVSAAASASGATWIDGNAEGWLDRSVDFADGFHPNNLGHQKFAERLAGELEQLVLAG